MEPWEAFDKHYNGQTNFMTPDVIRCGKAGTLFYELSSGDGFNGETIYGVTVLECLNGGLNKRQDLSGCHHSRKEAEDKIREMK